MLRAHWPAPGMLRLHSRGQPGVLGCDPLTEPEALADALAGAGAVICLSGVTPAHAATSGDPMSLNVDLARAARRASPTGARIFLASSAAVYGAGGGVHDESDAVTPVSDYGLAKLKMEQEGLADSRVCILRIGNVAGADAILGGWRAGMQIDQLPDGRTPRRSYIGPRSLAHALHALCLADSPPDIVNIAAPGVVAMGDLLDAADLDWTPRPAGAGVIAEVALATARLERFYRFSAQECTVEGIVAQWKEGGAGQ